MPQFSSQLRLITVPPAAPPASMPSSPVTRWNAGRIRGRERVAPTSMRAASVADGASAAANAAGVTGAGAEGERSSRLLLRGQRGAGEPERQHDEAVPA